MKRIFLLYILLFSNLVSACIASPWEDVLSTIVSAARSDTHSERINEVLIQYDQVFLAKNYSEGLRLTDRALVIVCDPALADVYNCKDGSFPTELSQDVLNELAGDLDVARFWDSVDHYSGIMGQIGPDPSHYYFQLSFDIYCGEHYCRLTVREAYKEVFPIFVSQRFFDAYEWLFALFEILTGVGILLLINKSSISKKLNKNVRIILSMVFVIILLFVMGAVHARITAMC